MDKSFCMFKGRAYKVILPQIDSDDLARKGDRLMLIHKHHDEPRFEIAAREVLHHGTAIGLFE